MPKFHVTYDVVTHESAEHGDYAESGFVWPDRIERELEPGVCGNAASAIKAQCALTLREACALMGCVESAGNGRSFYECDGRQDYQTGAETRRALHCPDSITDASYARIACLLGLKH